MNNFLSLLAVYIVGGITFLPACLVFVAAYVFCINPARDAAPASSTTALVDLRESADDDRALLSDKRADSLADKFRGTHEPDVAAGYFAVCREYVPGGLNGKPPERTTPAGVVETAGSPSVYQTMYKSLFDRKQSPNIDAGRVNGRAANKFRNVFFVVLRHGHLMLYNDDEQVEVKHVISLEHHNISLYGGKDEIPEGELWIKRNAIRLMRKTGVEEGTSKPFYLFSENCSEKEDFYFALLQNQEVKADAADNPPRPLEYDPRHIIGLVQRLHSSEEQLETRWLNALVGRLFLALYKTAAIEDFVHQKISKKIARAKKPAFLSNIILKSIGLGDSAPQMTNPRLRDLTIHGDCCVEADFKYNGNFRIEIAATARLDLGARFKVREVNIVLAVVIKKLNGRGLLKVKPAPSNRIWLTFERMPEMELAIEPIVSSRQITFGLIHRAIEGRIREAIAETIVLPHWDDTPFTESLRQAFRGGIWTDQKRNACMDKIPDESPGDGMDIAADVVDALPSQRLKDERAMSMPIMSDRTTQILPAGSESSSQDDTNQDLQTSPASVEQRADKPPKAIRSTSFASAANPLLSNAVADSVQHRKSRAKKQQKDATSAMVAISNKSRPTSSVDHDTQASQDSPEAFSVKTRKVNVSAADLVSGEHTSQLSNPSSEQIAPETFGDQGKATLRASGSKSQPLIGLGAASAAAKKWGWGVLGRNAEAKVGGMATANPHRVGTPSNPIGRGQPLPPLGQPLPSPSPSRSKTVQPASPKRRPSPLLPQNPVEEGKLCSPPLPMRRRQSSLAIEETHNEGLLVVQAPLSEPASPTDEKADNSAMIETDTGDSASFTAAEAQTSGSSFPHVNQFEDDVEQIAQAC